MRSSKKASGSRTRKPSRRRRPGAASSTRKPKKKGSATIRRPQRRKVAAKRKARPVPPPPVRERTPILFVGDLHGNVAVLDHIQEQFPDHLKIFVGDFLDSRDQFMRVEELMCLERVLTMIEQGNARACMGNHEWSYLDPSMRCSGYDPEFDAQLARYKERMQRLLEYFIWIPDQRILVTHAGLSFQVWQECHLTVENLAAKMAEWALLPVTDTPAGWIGISRGGVDDVGGIFWCDWYSEFQPVPGLTQIFGHTSAVSIQEELVQDRIGVRQRGSNYNIDCLMRTWEVLELGADGQLRAVPIFNEYESPSFQSGTPL